MSMRNAKLVGALVLLSAIWADGCGSNTPSTNLGSGGTTSSGGSAPEGTGGSTTSSGGTSSAPTETGGSTSTSTGSGGAAGATTASSGGSSGGGEFQPLCADLKTAAGVAPTKSGACTDSDPPLCYKTCGPQSLGFKSETCTTGAYAEQSGCSFPDGDYACYKLPDTADPSCPTTAPQATTPCSVDPCVICGGTATAQTTGYLDSGGSAKAGFCVCPASSSGNSKWSCASTTAWPCPSGSGC
jgi:hypothetical protein